MSENSLKEQLEAILKDTYPGEMKLFDEHVMQNPVLDAEQKFTIIFQLIMDKLESFKGKEELRERLSKPTVLWKDMTAEEKACIVHYLNKGVTVKFSIDAPSFACCHTIKNAYRETTSHHWNSNAYYWIDK